jgi:hypothetical protein
VGVLLPVKSGINLFGCVIMRSNQKLKKYPYIIVGMIHVVMLIFTIYKSTDRKKSIVLLLNYAGFAYIFEYIVIALLDGYVYKPRFLKSYHLDSIFGAVWSQLFYVPVTAIFITVFKLRWPVKLLFSLYFTLIEKIFTHLGIFKNNWWRTRYTFIFVLISFYINDKWSELLHKNNPLIMYVSLFNLIQVTWMNVIYLFAVLRKIRYGFPPFLLWKEHFRVAPFFGILISLVSASWIKKGGFISNLKVFIMLSLIDLTLLKKRILKIKSALISLIIYLILIVSSNYYRTLVYGRNNQAFEGT